MPNGNSSKHSNKNSFNHSKSTNEFDEDDVVDGELMGSRKSDIIDLTGYDSPSSPMGVTVYAGNGSDEVTGSLYDDVIWGGNGKDLLRGNDGDDEIYGQNGKDKLFGDAGDDSLWGGNGKDELFGGEGDDDVWGGNGKDHLEGGGGDDELFGEKGKDELFGGDGNDSLDGGGGKDKLVGGEDDGTFAATTSLGMLETVTYEVGDELTGGGGRDWFVYAFGDGVDLILDFSRGDQDRIKLVDIDQDDVAIFQDNGDSIIAFLDGATPDPDDLLADAAIIVEGVDDIDLNDILFA